MYPYCKTAKLTQRCFTWWYHIHSGQLLFLEQVVLGQDGVFEEERAIAMVSFGRRGPPVNHLGRKTDLGVHVRHRGKDLAHGSPGRSPSMETGRRGLSLKLRHGTAEVITAPHLAGKTAAHESHNSRHISLKIFEIHFTFVLLTFTHLLWSGRVSGSERIFPSKQVALFGKFWRQQCHQMVPLCVPSFKLKVVGASLLALP